jgi:hypothetical protein
MRGSLSSNGDRVMRELERVEDSDERRADSSWSRTWNDRTTTKSEEKAFGRRDIASTKSRARAGTDLSSLGNRCSSRQGHIEESAFGPPWLRKRVCVSSFLGFLEEHWRALVGGGWMPFSAVMGTREARVAFCWSVLCRVNGTQGTFARKRVWTQ